MQWILVTASFGGQHFHESGLRVIEQAKAFKVFHKLILVDEEALEVYAPRTLNKYKKYLNSEFPGYGYFAWKPEIINTILEMHPGYGVMYLDSGCELNFNQFTKLRLKRMLHMAKKGTFLHVLKYPEIYHTKRKVLETLNINLENALSPQFQATWFMLSNNVGKEISRNWLEATLFDLSMIDDSCFDEDPSFISHRHDQSVFSCVIKSLGIKPKRHKPCVRPITNLSKLNCSLHPIWSARNRSGVSIQRNSSF
jgi:hypothetical protein